MLPYILSVCLCISYLLLLPQGLKKISYSEFHDALLLLAKAKGSSVDEVQQALTAVGGPAINRSSMAAVTTADDTIRSHRGSESNS